MDSIITINRDNNIIDNSNNNRYFVLFFKLKLKIVINYVGSSQFEGVVEGLKKCIGNKKNCRKINLSFSDEDIRQLGLGMIYNLKKI